jgi:methylglyoxal synthase
MASNSQSQTSNSTNVSQSFEIGQRKRVALVAHDNKKGELLDWIKRNRDQILKHDLYATGTTGTLIEAALGISVTKYKSGPLGGDQQLGAKIAEQAIDVLIFFADPLEAQPHDSDVRALTRLASVWNIPMACNLSTADFLLTSPYMESSYTRVVPSFERYLHRDIKTKLTH